MSQSYTLRAESSNLYSASKPFLQPASNLYSAGKPFLHPASNSYSARKTLQREELSHLYSQPTFARPPQETVGGLRGPSSKPPSWPDIPEEAGVGKEVENRASKLPSMGNFPPMVGGGPLSSGRRLPWLPRSTIQPSLLRLANRIGLQKVLKPDESPLSQVVESCRQQPGGNRLLSQESGVSRFLKHRPLSR